MSSKHPNCSRDLFYSQEQLDKFEEMKDPDWAPKNLTENIYNRDDFTSDRKVIENND